MADIISHPWIQGKASTHQEFTARYDEVMEATRQMNINQTEMDIDFQIIRARGQQRGQNDKFASNFAETHIFNPCPQEVRGVKKTQLVVTNDSPLTIFSFLYDLVLEVDPNVQISEKTWKLKFEGVY